MKNLKRTKQYKECRARFAEVSERLAALYPGAECALEWRTDASDPADDGWRLLIMGRLSAQCTDARVNIVCRELFAAYPTAQAVADAPIEDLERLGHSCGFFRAKAQNIKDCCRIMVEEYEGRVPADREVLLTFPGVGRKIANLLRGDLFGLPAIGHCGGYPSDLHWRSPWGISYDHEGSAQGGKNIGFVRRTLGAKRFLPPRGTVRQRLLHGARTQMRGMSLGGYLSLREYSAPIESSVCATS